MNDENKRVSKGGVFGANLSDMVERFPTPRRIDGRSAGPGTTDAALQRRGGMANLAETIQIRNRGVEMHDRRFPTPRSEDAQCAGGHRGKDDTLYGAICRPKQYPTPTAQDAKNNGGGSQMDRNTPPLNAEVGGRLNPDWVEWLMGWPIGWTSLGPLNPQTFQEWLQRERSALTGSPASETDRCLDATQQHGKS